MRKLLLCSVAALVLTATAAPRKPKANSRPRSPATPCCRRQASSTRRPMRRPI